MRINIGPYCTWFGPYQLADKIVFWKKRSMDGTIDLHYKLGQRLEKSWVGSFLTWLHARKKRKIDIQIHSYDCWSADHTLAMVIHPVLSKLRMQKHGAPYVDDEDVPAHLRSTAAPPLSEEEKNNGTTDALWFKRWDYVLGEMVWAFEQHANPTWEDQYTSGEVDIILVKNPDAKYSTLEYGPNNSFKIHYERKRAAVERMDNGRRLFAKYYMNLWD